MTAISMKPSTKLKNIEQCISYTKPFIGTPSCSFSICTCAHMYKYLFATSMGICTTCRKGLRHLESSLNVTSWKSTGTFCFELWVWYHLRLQFSRTLQATRFSYQATNPTSKIHRPVQASSVLESDEISADPSRHSYLYQTRGNTFCTNGPIKPLGSDVCNLLI